MSRVPGPEEGLDLQPLEEAFSSSERIADVLEDFLAEQIALRRQKARVAGKPNPETIPMRIPEEFGRTIIIIVMKRLRAAEKWKFVEFDADDHKITVSTVPILGNLQDDGESFKLPKIVVYAGESSAA